MTVLPIKAIAAKKRVDYEAASWECGGRTAHPGAVARALTMVLPIKG